MPRLIMLFTAFTLILATGCSSAQTSPTASPAAATTATAVATVGPTGAPTATEQPAVAASATIAPTSAPTPTPNATATESASATAPATAADTPTAAPAATSASATVTPEATVKTGTNGGQSDFAPKVRSVWNTSVGLDQMSGTCPKGSMLPVYGLVQITPNGDTLNWKNQEPAPYTFSRLQPNIYRYAGPTALKDGVVTMTLTFVDDKSLAMTREFVASTDPACIHRHDYTGVFQWNKP